MEKDRIRDGKMRIRDGKSRIRDQTSRIRNTAFLSHAPINKPPGTWQQTSDKIYTCTKSYGAMNANDPVISQPITCKLRCKSLNSDQIIP